MNTEGDVRGLRDADRLDQQGLSFLRIFWQNAQIIQRGIQPRRREERLLWRLESRRVTRSLNEFPRILMGVIPAVVGRAFGLVPVPTARQQSAGLFALAVAGLLIVGCTPNGLRVDGQKIEGKIGLVDSSRVWNDSNLGKKMKDTLSAHQKNRQALLEADARELQRMQEEVRRFEESRSFQPDGILRRKQQLQQRFEEYQQKSMELNREIQDKGREVSENFRAKVDGVVGKVAKRLGLQVVIEKGKGGPTFYSEEGLDLTNQVIEEFNREYP